MLMRDFIIKGVVMNNEYDRRLKRKQQKDIAAGRCKKEEVKPVEKKPVVEEVISVIKETTKPVYNFNKTKK